jgi:type I restriction enzyme, S subunit
MSEWPVKRLEELCADLTVGHVGSMASQYVADGVPFLRSQNVRKGHLDLGGLKYISPEFHQQLRKSRLQPGDIVMVRTGEPGAAALIPGEFEELNCADLVIARPARGVDPRFLCYSINATAEQYISAYLVGAVQQHFNVGSARNLEISLPSFPEQKAIADVLEALDDKAAVNDQIAVEGEELALTIASDKRWTQTASLGEIVSYVRNQVVPEGITADVVALYSLPSFDAGQLPEIVLTNTIKSGKFLVDGPAVLLSKLNPVIPRVWSVKPDRSMPALASTEFMVLTPVDGITQDEVWAVSRQPTFIGDLVGMATGTSNSHQRVRPNDLLATPVVDPRSMPAADRAAISSIAERCREARLESRMLLFLRDALLPKLMSGVIRVRDAEKVVEEVT